MKKKLQIIVGLLLCYNAHSQVTQFNNALMHGGSIESFAKNASNVLVATEGGIYKTTNLGQSWSNASQGFNPMLNSCKQIMYVNNNFYAMPEDGWGDRFIYKSTDNGTSWTSLGNNGWYPSSIGRISNTLYAMGSDMSGIKLYSSTDGATWTPKATLWTGSWMGGNNGLISCNHNKLYIELQDMLLFTQDGNTIDTVFSTGLGVGSGFNDLDRGFGGDVLGNIYYNSDGVIYKYNFTSKSWSDISTGKIPAGYQVVEFSVTDNALFISAMSTDMRLYRSTNQGSTFTYITAPGITVPMIGNIIEVGANSFIGNDISNKVIYSSNGGDTWTSNTNQYIATEASNLSLSGNTLIYSREVVGMTSTANQGSTWALANNGVPGFSGIAFFVNDIIPVKDQLFTFVMSDPFTETVELYKSSNDGATWAASLIPAPYNNGDGYSFAGVCDSGLFVSYYNSSSTDYSTILTVNNGTTWTSVANSSGRLFLKGSKSCLFGFEENGYNSWDGFNNIKKSSDFGATFSDANNMIFNDQFLIKRVRGNRGDKAGPMMDYDAIGNKAIFGVIDRTMGSGIDKLYRYNMSTEVWSEITTTGLPANYIVNCIKYAGNNIWLLATNLGLYRSLDGGNTWSATHSSANWQNGMVVNSIQTIGLNVFFGTLANGVWKVDNALGVADQDIEVEWFVSPNPTSDFVNISLPQLNNELTKLSLYGIDGKLIFYQSTLNGKFLLNMQKLSSGTYYAVVQTQTNVYRKAIIRK